MKQQSKGKVPHSGLPTRRVWTLGNRTESLWMPDHSTGGSHTCLPEAGVSGGPFKLVLLPQMNREVVSSGKTLVTDVALVARHKIPLDLKKRNEKHIRLQLPSGRGFSDGKGFAVAPRALVCSGSSWCGRYAPCTCSPPRRSGRPARWCGCPGVSASPPGFYNCGRVRVQM